MTWDLLYALLAIVGFLFFTSVMILSVWLMYSWLAEYRASENEELESPDDT